MSDKKDSKPSILSTLASLEGSDGAAGTEVITDMMSRSEHLGMRTDLDRPIVHTKMKVLARYWRSRGFLKLADFYDWCVDVQQEHLVSKKRQGRKEAFKVFGSGFDSKAVMAVAGAGFMLGIFTVATITGAGLLWSLPMGAGYVFYFCLTLAYCLGVVLTFTRPSGGED